MKRRRWFEVHSWLGVFAGLMLFVICWSGTVAVFAHEIDWLLDARLRAPAPAAQDVAWQRMAETVEVAYPNAERYSLHAPLQAGYAGHAVVDTPAQQMQRVYLDARNGELLGSTSYFNVQRFFRSLHMSLFDLGSGRMWGYWTVGAFSVLLLASAIAPLLFYRRWWRGFTTLKTARGPRVFWSDLHKLCGVWTLAFAFLMALTGIWYTVEFFDVDLGYPAPPAPGVVSEPARHLPVGETVARARAQWPGLVVTAVTPATGSYWGDAVHLQGQADAWLVRDRANFLMLDPVTGEPLYRHDAVQLGWPERWVDTADPLHFGDFGGLWTKAVWFVFGLLLSALCLTGAYLHVQRLRSVRDGPIWRGTGIAIAVTFSLLAIAAWGGWKEITGYGPLIDGRQVAPEVNLPVAAFLAAWVVLTLLILGVWSWAVLRSGHAAARALRSAGAVTP